VLLPGIVAGYVPWRFFGVGEIALALTDPLQVSGLLATVAGVALLAVCIWEFAKTGRGTLSPADPPKALVVGGLYRRVRNPMYLSVATILLGESMMARSPALLGYCAAWFAVVNLFVIGYEEPMLRRQFGQSYDEYAAAAGRWLPRLGRR
jgi:protein-S-isoprenylcysteine O-methyltransferase Ste14